MFARTRPKLPDEDAPPTTSLNDMFNDYTRAHPSTNQPSYAKVHSLVTHFISSLNISRSPVKPEGTVRG
jgi:hypothetical protein